MIPRKSIPQRHPVRHRPMPVLWRDFGCDNNIARRSKSLCDEAFAMTLPVSQSRVEEVNPKIMGLPKSHERAFVLGTDPRRSAYAPAAKSNLTYLNSGPPQSSVVHTFIQYSS